MRSLAATALVAFILGVWPLAACDSPPQIIDIQPERGAGQVRSNEPVRIRFDRPVDQQSVAARFGVTPRTAGKISWESASSLIFQHESFQPDTTYSISLGPGYRDAHGIANPLRHSWSFVTESPPALRSTAPGSGEQDVDPTAYLLLNYSRDMDPQSFTGAVTFSPEVSYAVRVDASDARRVVIAPRSVLDPLSRYQVTVTGDARDIDGNRAPPVQITFTTGAARPLTHWITFVAAAAGGQPGEDIWMVDEQGFPRVLAEGPADAFTVSPDGTHLLIQHPELRWTDYQTGGASLDLSIEAVSAAWLGPGHGYVYLTPTGELLRRLADGSDSQIASGVRDFAVAPELTRVAFVVGKGSGEEIRGYDVSLRSQYRIQAETGAVRDLRWAPNGNSLAYVLKAALDQLRIKSLTGAGRTVTAATGQLSSPAWLGDTGDLVFQAAVDVKGVRHWRIYRVGASVTAPITPTATDFLGSALDTDMTSPTASADGHQIAFLAGASTSSQVWLMNADGTGMRRLTAYDATAFPFACVDLHWAG